MRMRSFILCTVIALFTGNASVANATDLRIKGAKGQYFLHPSTTNQDLGSDTRTDVGLQKLQPTDGVTGSYQNDYTKDTKNASSESSNFNISHLTAIFLAGDDSELREQVINLVIENGGRVIHVLPQLLLVELSQAKFVFIETHHYVLDVRQNTVKYDKIEGLDLPSARIWNSILEPDEFDPISERVLFEEQLIEIASSGVSLTATSEFLIGTVVVSVIHPYCDEELGGSCIETPFSQAELDSIMANVTEAMNWWAAQETNANLRFLYEPIEAVGIYTDPLSGCNPPPDGCSGNSGQWRLETMESLGYSGTNVSALERQYADDLRNGREPATTQGWDANWGFLAYVPKSTGWRRSYASQPIQVDWNGDSVSTIAHETGHIFQATDEYFELGRRLWPWQGCEEGNTNCYWGYLGRVVGGNRYFGFVNERSLMKDAGLTGVSTFTRAAIGWVDTDGELPTDWGADNGPASGSPYSHVISMNLGGDNYPDLAAIKSGSNDVIIWANNTSGGWVGAGSIDINTSAKDLIYLKTSFHMVVAEDGGPIRTFWTVVCSDMSCPPSIPERSNLSVVADALAAGDVNIDGYEDLIVAKSSGGIAIYSWDSTSNAWTPYTSPVSAAHFSAFAIGDFNQDTIPDIVASSDNPGGLHLWTGEGPGTWNALTTISSDEKFLDVWASDIDGDEHFDLIASIDPISVAMWTGDGEGGFESYWAPIAGAGRQIWMADLDHDLKLDLIMAWGNDGIIAQLNNQPGNWPLGAILGAGNNYQSGVAVADYNRDGYPDIAGSSNADNKLSVWLNPGLVGDGLLDLVDTFPDTTLDDCPTNVYQGTVSFTGTATDIPHPRGSPGSPGPDTSINTIQLVEYRVDGSAWSPATTLDGAFDEGEEAFSFNVGPLSNGTHTIEVQSKNLVPNTSLGNTEEAPEECQLTVSPPVPPSNVQVSDGTFTDKVQVTWDPVSGATSYEVYRATSEAGAKTLIGSPTGTSLDDATAVAGTPYYFWVKACGDTGCSDYSAHDTGWRRPLAPGNVEASDGTFTDKVLISWDPVSGATSYEVYRATSEAGAKTLIGSPTGTSLDDTTAVAGTLYHYWVKTCVDSYCSDHSVFDTGWRRPLAPENVEASDGTFTDKVLISWDPLTVATSYEVYHSTSEAGAKTLIGSPTGTSLDDTTAVAGTLYHYWVKACVDSYCSDYSVFDTGWRRPLAPGNVDASDGTFTDKVLISWDPLTGATSYEVYRATSEAGTKTLIGSPTGTSFDDTTAVTGTLYHYWVKACVDGYCSAYSDYDTGWRNIIAPGNLQASNGSDLNKVVVTWDSSTDATSYKIYRATTAGGTKNYRGSRSGTSFNDTSAVPGKMYYYWVKACIGSKCSSFSAYDTGWRMLTPLSSIQASNGTYTDKVRVYWSTSWGATSYEVYRASSSVGTKTKIGSPSGTSLEDTSATPGITYYYWVKACSGPRCSDFSPHDDGWRNLTPPSNLQATHGSDTSKVGLTWDPSSGATSYNVYRATSEGGTKSLLGSPASNSFDDTSVTPGITYYYWVKACSGSRCSDFSSYDTGWRMLTAPSNVSATYGTYTDKIHISWDPSSGATSYRIYRATSDIGIKTEISTVSGTSYDDISALPGTIYYFWVKACRDARCSAYSDYDTGYRALPKPPKPTNVKASDGKFATKVQITWNLTPGASSYKVYRSTTPKGTKVYLGSTPGTSFDDTTASPAQAYYYRVKACNSSGCSPYSAYDKGWRKTKKSFRSIANHDGWVLESSETSNKGGSKRYTQMTLRIGDDPRDRQYCSIISFNTKAVPDGAVITAAKLKILKVNVVGTNPFTTHGTLWAAVRKGYFGTSIGLQASDFQASASASSAAKFVPIPSTKWYRARMKSSTLVYIDRAGFTQFRLCFSLDDNDDNSSDFIKFFSGNEANKASRPKLEVFYYVP